MRKTWRRKFAEWLAPEILIERNRAQLEAFHLQGRLHEVQTVEQRLLRLEADYGTNKAQNMEAGRNTLNDTLKRVIGLLAELTLAADAYRGVVALSPGSGPGRRLSLALQAARQELPPGLRDPEPPMRELPEDLS